MGKVKIYAPNKGYTGVSAGVAFAKGVAVTDDPWLIQWFKKHGYRVEDENKSLDDMKVPELKELAKEKKIEGYSDMKKDELLEALKAVEKVSDTE